MKVYPKYLDVQRSAAPNVTFTFFIQGTKTGIETINFTSTNNSLGFTEVVVKVVNSIYLEDIIFLLKVLSYIIISLSMYPQLYTIKDIDRLSIYEISGMSNDFVYLNLLARALMLFNTLQMSCLSMEEYRTRYPKGLIPITGVDNAFAFHGFIVASILCLQSNRYPGADKKLSTTAKVIVIFCIIVPNIAYFLEMLGFIQWLDVIYVHRFEEWLLLFLRYLPQVRHNFRRKCTLGWNIWGPLVELLGLGISGVSVLLQIINLGWIVTPLENTFVELIIIVFAILYIIIFIVQHFIYYYEPEIDTTSNKRNSFDSCECEQDKTLYYFAY
ncbi:cystinosin homolog [Aethina tumida]|uniref:cystinosin homolog n=1 Tax=Aethina tumida TaxID=116153 RepID=UPI002148D30F|nr:cystinosin homolog [Aethina tumida]